MTIAECSWNVWLYAEGVCGQCLLMAFVLVFLTMFQNIERLNAPVSSFHWKICFASCYNYEERMLSDPKKSTG